MPTVAQQDQPLPGSLEEAQQRYETTKKALKAGLLKKRQIDRALTDLESQIFLFEGSYLASTAASGGNIVKGFDGYLKSTASSGGHSHSRGGGAAQTPAAHLLTGNDIPMEDRMFSQSSATYTRSLQLKANEGRSREQSPATQGVSSSSSSKKGSNDKASEKTVNGASDKVTSTEKGSGGGGGGGAKEKSASSKKEKAKDETGDVSMDKKASAAVSVDGSATPTSSSKSKKRDKDKDASVNGGSHKKKRKDDS